MWDADGKLCAVHYATGKVVRVARQAGRIGAIEPVAGGAAVGEVPSTWLAPGLIDLQVNGYGGHDFTSDQLTVEQVVAISRGLDRHGVTGYLPTIITSASETILHALRTIDRACRECPEAAQRILGVHVEGPFISPVDGPRGAHPREHCRPPDWHEFERWREAAGGRIRLITLSPEYDEAPDFIRQAVAAGVLIAIGHTNATSDQIAAAVDAGARMSTHLGNGAHPQIRRHPNYIWDQLADDRLTASIITDGHHLPASVVKCFVRAKGNDRIVLVSDMTGMAGMPPGRYATALGAVEVLESGKLVVAGQRELLAGAALPIEHCVPNVARYADVSLAAAIDMASTAPARLIGVEHALQPGAAANLMLFRPPAASGPLEIVATINQGEVVFTADSSPPRNHPGDA